MADGQLSTLMLFRFLQPYLQVHIPFIANDGQESCLSDLQL